MLKKRASMVVVAIKLILLIIALIILFNFLYKLYAKSTKFNDEKACHNAIVLQYTLSEKIPTTKYSKPWPSVCKTRDMVSDAKDAEDAEKELAELMSWCYWMMGEGTIKPFDRDWWSGGRKCFVCYTAQFPKLRQPINEQEFTFFLQENRRKGMTYYDYLKYGQDKLINNPVTDPIDSQKTYVIVYTSPSDPTFGFIVTCLGYAAAGAGTGATAGAIGCGIIGAIIAGPPGAIVGGLFCGIVGAQWGAAGTYAVCGVKGAVEAAAKYIQQSKEDLVYVSDVNRGKAGCFGSWYEDVGEVHTI